MAGLMVQLRDELADRLESEARRLNISVDQLVELGLHDFLTRPDPDFERIADRIVRENRGLYRRLAG